MPQRITIPFVGGTNRSKFIKVNNQATVNLVNSIRGEGAKAPVVLESIPGNVDVGAAGDGACRTPKLVNWKGALYGVFGTKLVKITSKGATSVGTLTSGATGRCSIARGRNYILVVDGVEGYTWNDTTFAAVADPDFPAKPTHAAYQDGFFIVNDADTDNFYICETVEDPTAWNALDFEAASAAPDHALAHCSSQSILYIAGDETTQLYYNSGNADFPFALIQSATQEVGILAPDSMAESDDGVFFLATTPEGGRFVYRIQGQAGEVISGNEQADLLEDVEDPTTAYGFVYKQGSHRFYVLQLDDGDLTLVYNIVAKRWEERQLQDGSGWRAAGHGVLDNQNIIGSRLAARYYRLDPDVYEDAGEELVRRRVTQIVHVNDHLLDWHEVVIDVQAGVGNASSPDPQLRLRHTDDNGDWSSQLIAPMGKAGERIRRCVFRNLGLARGKQLEVECADRVPLTIVSAYAVVTVLND
jgi:hypothetical protein